MKIDSTRLQEITSAQFYKQYVKKEVSLCLATPHGKSNLYPKLLGFYTQGVGL